MPDETNNANEQEQPSNSPIDERQNEGGSIDDLPSWAQDLIKTTRAEAAKYRVAKREAEEQARQREQARLAEEGKWKELAEQRSQSLAELEPYKEYAQTTEAFIREMNQRRLEQIPESFRGLVPEDYEPVKLAKWLETNWHALQNRPAPSTDAGAGAVGGGKTVQLTPEQKQVARAMGMTEEQFIAALQKSQNK